MLAEALAGPEDLLCTRNWVILARILPLNIRHLWNTSWIDMYYVIIRGPKAKDHCHPAEMEM